MALHNEMYKIALKDNEFVYDMSKSKNNKLPSRWFADELEIAMWASAYYGYLVGTQGVDYADSIKDKAKSI